MQKTGIAGYASTPGNRGIWMLRRDIDEHTEFLMFTLWESLDSVKAFAGPDYETAVFYPEDDRFLVERDQFSTHYFVHTHIAPPERRGRPRPRVRDHVAAFNTQPRPSLGLPQHRHALGHRKRSLPRHRRTREAVRKRIHGLEPQTDIKYVVIDGDEVACELSEHLVVDGATRRSHRRLLSQRRRVVCFAVIGDQAHELLAAADPVHGRPQAGVEIHQRFQQAAGAWHEHDLRFVLLDRADDGLGDLLRRDHEGGVRLPAELVERALAEAGVLDGAQDDRGSGDAGAAVVVPKDAAEGDQPVLAGRVGLSERKADPAGDRGDADDPAVTSLEHRW